jgi:hypothetical protein
MSETEGGEMLVAALVTVAYLEPSVLFGLALKPAAEVVERVGRSAAV